MNASRFTVWTGLLAAMALGGCFSSMGASGSTRGGANDANPLPAKDWPIENADAERLAWTAAQTWAPSQGTPAPTILRAYVRGRDWLINRNAAGTVTDRTLQAYVMYKGGQSGKCRSALTVLKEENLGGDSWGPAMILGTNTVIAVTCDSIDPLRPSPPQ